MRPPQFSGLSALPEAELRYRKLFLEDYRILLKIGVGDAERSHPQPMLVSIEAWVPFDPTLPSIDTIQLVFDYDQLKDAILACVERQPFHLQEYFCDLLVERLSQYISLKALRVRVAKTKAYADCGRVGVERCWIRPE